MTSTKKTLLIVDDDEDWLSLLGKLLASEGYRVLKAQTCDSALRLAERTRPDCLIADIGLACESGLTLCGAVKGLPALKDVRVLILSGLDAPPPGSPRQWDAFVCKADGTSLLLQAIKKILA